MRTLMLIIFDVINYFSAFCQKQEGVDLTQGYDIGFAGHSFTTAGCPTFTCRKYKCS